MSRFKSTKTTLCKNGFVDKKSKAFRSRHKSSVWWNTFMLSKQNWEHLHLMLKSVSTEFVILNGKFCLYILCIVIVKTKNWEVKQRKAVKKKSRKFATKASINLIGKRKKEFSFCLCFIKCSDQIRQSKSNRLRFCFFFPSNSLTLYEMAKISRT